MSPACPRCLERDSPPDGDDDALYTVTILRGGRPRALAELAWEDVLALVRREGAIRVETEPIPASVWKAAIGRFGTSD